MTQKFSDIIKSETPVLVDFFAEWCGPCKTMKPILEDLKNRMGDKIKIVKIDTDKNPQLSGSYQVQSIPTLILFRDGVVKWKQAGVVPAKKLEEIIEQFSK